MPLGLSLNELLGSTVTRLACTMMTTSMPRERCRSAPWNPMTLRGHVASGVMIFLGASRCGVFARLAQRGLIAGPTVLVVIGLWLAAAAPVADLGNWTGGSGQVHGLPASAEGRERNGSEGARLRDGRTIRACRRPWSGYGVAARVFSSDGEARRPCDLFHPVLPNV